MSEETNERPHIVVSKKTKESLDAAKIHPRETYEDVILRLLSSNGLGGSL